MEISQLGLALFVAVSFVFGILCGIVYDTVSPLPSIFGKIHSSELHGKLAARGFPFLSEKKVKGRAGKTAESIAVFVHDLVFTVIAGCSFSVLTYVFNDGIIRIGAIIGLAAGVFVYRKLFRKLFLKLAEGLKLLIFGFLWYTVHFLMIPFMAIIGRFKRTAEKIKRKKLEKYIIRYSDRQKKLLAEAARLGFLNGCDEKEKQRKGKDGHGRFGEEKTDNNFCDIVYAFGVCDSRGCKSDELQSASEGNGKARS